MRIELLAHETHFSSVDLPETQLQYNLNLHTKSDILTQLTFTEETLQIWKTETLIMFQ